MKLGIFKPDRKHEIRSQAINLDGYYPLMTFTEFTKEVQAAKKQLVKAGFTEFFVQLEMCGEYAEDGQQLVINGLKYTESLAKYKARLKVWESKQKKNKGKS